jgi:hypothetical protein
VSLRLVPDVRRIQSTCPNPRRTRGRLLATPAAGADQLHFTGPARLLARALAGRPHPRSGGGRRGEPDGSASRRREARVDTRPRGQSRDPAGSRFNPVLQLLVDPGQLSHQR